MIIENKPLKAAGLKPGQLVRCIRPGISRLTVGEIYTLDQDSRIPDPRDPTKYWAGGTGVWELVEDDSNPVTDAAPRLKAVDEMGSHPLLKAVDETNTGLPRAGTPATGYPDGNPKTQIGMTKPPISVVPPVAIFQLGQAMKDGKEKYGLMNWREHSVSSSVYYDAAMRHLMAWWDGEQTASDSGVHHLGHAMACMAILIDAEAAGQLNDDRPRPGPLPKFLKDKTAA